jgi:hypothetical protein
MCYSEKFHSTQNTRAIPEKDAVKDLVKIT